MKKLIIATIIILIIGCTNPTIPPINHAEITNPISGEYYPCYSTIEFEVTGTSIEKIAVWTSVNSKIIYDDCEPFIINIKTEDYRSITVYSIVTFINEETIQLEITMYMEG